MMTHEEVRAINGGSVIINKKKSMDENIQDTPVEVPAEEVVAEVAPVEAEVAAPEAEVEAPAAEEVA